MKNKFIYRIVTACCLFIIIGGCGKSDEFTVKGVIAGATGQILYLENTGLSTVIPVDSLKLKPDGKFLFKQKRPQYPDFYRLKLKNQRLPIHFSIDSSETVVFTADAHNFATSYTVEGSENCKAIKEITLAQLDANHEIRKLRDSRGMNLIPDTTYQESALKAINSYKDIALKYIFGAPASPVAYFALFQQIDGLWFFDLYDRTDSKAYGAVATSHKAYYPESPRAKQLESLALQSMRVTRGERRKNLNLDDAEEVNFIDIDLPDINDNKIKLSNIVRGKAVLINFTAYQTEWSPTFNIKLNELYGKYKGHGFEIYQISLDSDAHFWKNAASNIPWTSVRDPQSIYSSIAAIYNVRQLPALFLINKKGEMAKRIESIETIEDDIKSVL
ncbi:MAG: AhpC/TSA family protein [Tannerella sp.]|jgi:peroxiredoxin|nr:AhpC/TSA family protein [Tannerella sp.]